MRFVLDRALYYFTCLSHQHHQLVYLTLALAGFLYCVPYAH